MNISEFKKVIWEYTRKINENTNKSFNPIFEEHGLTMLQARVLMELYYYGSNSIGNLAESTYVAGANISTICKRLEKEGLVERTRNQEDERIVMVVLTEMGNKSCWILMKSLIKSFQIKSVMNQKKLIKRLLQE